MKISPLISATRVAVRLGSDGAIGRGDQRLAHQRASWAGWSIWAWERASTIIPTSAAASATIVPAARRPAEVQRLAEQKQTKQDAADRIRGGAGRHRRGQRTGVEGELIHGHRRVAHRHQCVQLPAGQDVHETDTEPIHHRLGQSGAQREQQARSGTEQCGPTGRRGPAGGQHQRHAQCGTDGAGDQPRVTRGVVAPARRIGDGQESDQCDDDQCRRADLRPVDPLVTEPDTKRYREHDTEHEHRLHDGQTAAGQRSCLRDEAEAVSRDPGQPHRPPGQAQHEPGV